MFTEFIIDDMTYYAREAVLCQSLHATSRRLSHISLQQALHAAALLAPVSVQCCIMFAAPLASMVPQTY